MNITNRFAVTALLVLAVTAVLGTTAPASAGGPKWFMKDTFVNVGDERHAAGWWGIDMTYRYLQVSCQGLTPGASYVVSPVGIGFQADNHGRGGFVVNTYPYPVASGVKVYRYGVTGYVLVLESP